LRQALLWGLRAKPHPRFKSCGKKPDAATVFENLYIVGEGSGYSGGIISSGSDGIKAAMNIIERNSHGNISVE